MNDPRTIALDDSGNYGDFGEWVTCWMCGGDGGWDLYEEDPLSYDEDDFEQCGECAGAGGWSHREGA